MTEPFNELDRDLDHDRLVETPESLRDEDPEAMPLDRGLEAGDRPAAAERFGTTPREEAQGQSLDDRLSEERPDVGAHDPMDDVVASNPDAFPTTGGPDTRGGDDFVALGEDVSPDDEQQAGDVGVVGRVVEPDEGAHADTEKDAVARDVGRDGGDRSAEESALHVEPD
ncbi:MAG TPA: DUF5709 domain-containing protein [Candidatus Eisenbacteria bacterium]|nr:DUF5709 domain-containing protein [Candidatus Eisenbacteria bacterium]